MMERAYLFCFDDPETKETKDCCILAEDNESAIRKFFEEVPIDYGQYYDIFKQEMVFVQREYIAISDRYSEYWCRESELTEKAYRELIAAWQNVERCLSKWKKHLIRNEYAFHLSARVLQKKRDFNPEEKREIYRESVKSAESVLEKWRIKK